MDSYSSFYYKGIIIPALSALTLTATGSSPINPCIINSTSDSPNSVEYHIPYSSIQDSNSNKTVGIDTDLVDLMTIKSFAEKILNGMEPVQESIQAVIDDYFWEML